MLIERNPEYWGAASPYGKQLTETRFGRMIVQACKATSSRPGGGPRGFARSQFEFVWQRLGISRSELDEPGEGGEPGTARDGRVHRDSQPSRVGPDGAAGPTQMKIPVPA